MSDTSAVSSASSGACFSSQLRWASSQRAKASRTEASSELQPSHSPMPLPEPTGLTPIDPQDIQQQASISINGVRLTGEPGSVKYTAPYYLPESARSGMPRVLYSDPWPSMADVSAMHSHAQACLRHVREKASMGSGTRLSAIQVHEGINAAEEAAGRKAMLSSLAYTTRMLESLRAQRLVIGRKNPASDLQQGHPQYPYLYEALPEQAMYKKPPTIIAQLEAKARSKEVQQALKRVKRRKSPFGIHRPVATHSAYQHALAHEAMQKFLA